MIHLLFSTYFLSTNHIQIMKLGIIYRGQKDKLRYK